MSFQFTEAHIQIRLHDTLRRNGHKTIIPNLYLTHGECDLISVTRSGYLNEYEIKITARDLKADFKKFKHQHIYSGMIKDKTDPGSYKFCPDYLKSMPSKFWYVLADTIKFQKLHIPEYAGVMLVSKQGKITVYKNPIKLHKEKTTAEYRVQWLETATYKIFSRMAKLLKYNCKIKKVF